MFLSCSTVQVKINKSLKLNYEHKKFAVLNFGYQGFNLSSKLAQYASDQLSAELFLRKHFSIVDRSLVRATLKKYSIRTNQQLTAKDINTLNKELNADYLVLGNLYSESSFSNLTKKHNNIITLNIRFLKADSCNIVGMVTHTISSNESVTKIINRLVKETVDAIKIK